MGNGNAVTATLLKELFLSLNELFNTLERASAIACLALFALQVAAVLHFPLHTLTLTVFRQ